MKHRLLERGAGFPAISVLVVVLVVVLAFGAVGSPRYEIDLVTDWANGTYAGSLSVVVENPLDTPLDELILRLFPNDDVVYAGALLRVHQAWLGGQQLEPAASDDPTVFVLPLFEPLQPGQTASVRLRFEGQAGPSPADVGHDASGYGMLTKNDSTLVLTAFYPMLSPFGETGPIVRPPCDYGDALWGDAAEYMVRLTTAESLSPISTGRLASSDRLGEVTLHTFEASQARDFALILTSGIPEIELQSGSRSLRAWFHPARSEAAIQALSLASSAADLFTALIGPLPYNEIDLVEVPLHRAAGIEFTGLILLSSTFTTAPREVFFDILVSHEMAHQWFYAAVGNDPIASAWLDEGPATFLSNVFLDHVGRTADADGERQRWGTSYEAAQNAAPLSSLASASCAFPSGTIYGDFVYEGGAHFLQTVRDEIGDDAFFTGLRGYYAAHVGSIGSTHALLEAFEDACACDLSGIFESFGVHRTP